VNARISVRRRRRRSPAEEGSALVLALLFLTVSAVVVTALIGFTTTSSSATIALRAARGTDYDATSAMEGAIATIRVGATEGYAGNCLTGGYTPTWSLNNPSRPVRVDCYPRSSSATQRRVVLSVCPASVSAPCPDASSLLRVDVIFYDDGTFGRAVGVQTWSNQ
jgi:hypothetical protein